jgi:hypothetical protein
VQPRQPRVRFQGDLDLLQRRRALHEPDGLPGDLVEVDLAFSGGFSRAKSSSGG